MAKFNRIDLEHILRQIMMAENGQPPLSPHLAFGLRQVNGENNNSVPGNGAFGSADQLFPRVGDQYLQNGDTYSFDLDGPGGQTVGDATSYTQTTGFVFDADPRIISNLISDQTANNAAAVAAHINSTPGTGYVYQHAAVVNPNFDPLQPESLSNPQFLANNVAIPSGVDASGNLFIANVTPDAGLSAPFNSWFTFFGQFFDHGLDLVSKGGNGFVYIPLQADDPLILVGPDGMPGTGDEITNPGQQFMLLTRATQFNGPGANGIFGDADDTAHEAQNTTTPFVDQNQTYSSHPAHQVFLREYARFDSNGAGADGWVTVSTGKLLNGADGHSMATWADVKANALKLGIILNDTIDVVNIPLIKTDAYGNFIPAANGLAQLVTGTGGDGLFGTDDDVTISGTVNPDGSINAITTAGAARIDHAFLNDIAHTANPVNSQTGAFLNGVSDGVVNDTNGNGRIDGAETPIGAGNFDVDLLNRHYIAGDGRVNENIGLTAVHEIFHSEHNRQIELIKAMVRAELANGDTAFATDWTLPGVNLADGIQDNEFNGERLFQAAKFATETQYQHIVFEEFARKVAPNIHLFGNNAIDLDPAITAEFAHAVYRFGHSMLDEMVNRYVMQEAFLDANGVPTATNTGRPNPLAGTPMLDLNGDPVLNDVGLIQAFLNPELFAGDGSDATANIVLGSVNQIGNEIDEFVTGALRNNLVGLPIDLAALNIARGRDTGVPPLNLLRNQIFTQLNTGGTGDTNLKPYASWDEFGQFLKHPESLVNFIAAYGTHSTILAAGTNLADRRAAAQALVDDGTLGSATFSQDAYNFLHSLDSYANAVHGVGVDGVLHTADDTFTTSGLDEARAQHAGWSTGSVTGVDAIDLWIGGLAEKQNLFGGLLGSTFNFIFETQMEALQDGDRLYYLPRIEGIEFGTQIENSSFAELIMLNTGLKHLSASIFLTPEYNIEASNYFLKNSDGSFQSAGAGADGILNTADDIRIATDPSTWQRNGLDGNLLVEVLPDGTVHFIGDDNFFGNTMVLGGTPWNDRLQAGQADDDTVYGDEGDDWIDGGNGNDFLYGGAGNDLIQDSSGDDVIHGDDGDDTIDAGSGDDIVFGNEGNDLIHLGNSILGDEGQGGAGNDIIFGDEGDDAIIGNAGDDWLSGGAGGDGLVGDVGAPTGQVPLYGGNDVLDGGGEGDKMVGFSGDDIMLGEGGFDKFNGLLGFDWGSFEKTTAGVSVDMDRREFVPAQTVPAGDAVRDFFVETEAVSGSAFNDVLKGTTDLVIVDPVTGARVGAAASVFNVLENVDLIFGLSGFFAPGPVHFDTGNIMLGGDGSDFIEGRAGDDILDGDAWLHVDLTRDANGNIFAGSEITRDIFFDITDGDVDTAVYNDVLANYIISPLPDAQGFYTVSQIAVTPGLLLVNDGVDRIRNIERLQFADGTFTLNQLLGLAPGPNENAVPTGAITLASAADNAATAIVEVTVGTPIIATDTIADADGIAPGSVHYQWQDQQITAGGGIAWVDIAGANSLTFTPTNAQLGNALRLFMTYTDGVGFHEQAFSLATELLAPNVTVNTAPFIVQQQNPPGLPDTNARTGNPLNLFLNVTTNFSDNETAPAALIYTATLGNGQVLDGSAAAGGLVFVVQGAAGAVTGAFVMYDPDLNGVADPLVAPLGTITIRVTATDIPAVGPALSITDTFLINVQRGNFAPIAGAFAPQNISEGDGINGGADTFSGTLTGSDPDSASFAFRLVAGSVIGGTLIAFNQTTGAFTFVANGDEFPGSTLPAGAGFDFTVFDGQLSSAPSQVRFDVQAIDDGQAPISITGTAANGGTLSAVIGVDPDGEWDAGSATYEWFRNGVSQGVNVGNPDYLVGALDVGQRLSVKVTYTDAQLFTTSFTTPQLAPIGVLSVRPLGANNVAPGTLTAFSTIVDPDGDLPGAFSNLWSVSTTVGGPFLPVPALGADVDVDGNLVLPNNSIMFVQLTQQFVDAAFNLNEATSEIVRVRTGNNNGQSLSSAFAGTDILLGLGGNDVLNGDGGNDFLYGGSGNDSITGGAGNDVLSGGLNSDNINGGAGNDTILYTMGDSVDQVNGGNDADTLIIVGQDGAVNESLDVIFNGTSLTRFQAGSTVTNVESVTADLLDGVDTLTYDPPGGLVTTAAVSVNLALGTASGFTSIAGIENVTGGSGADTLVGDDGANILDGGTGNDSLRGGAGNDTLIG
ncbi:MAG: peroxidase family protein, partial [Terricaulis sp.]